MTSELQKYFKHSEVSEVDEDAVMEANRKISQANLYAPNTWMGIN